MFDMNEILCAALNGTLDKQLNEGKMSEVVEKKSGGYVLVDTCNTIDHDWETMVFECDAEGNVEDWGELDCERYDSQEEAKEGHNKMVEEWKAR